MYVLHLALKTGSSNKLNYSLVLVVTYAADVHSSVLYVSRFIWCRFDRLLREVTICLVGKYTRLQDSYTSVVKALSHAAMACNYKLDLKVAYLFRFIFVLWCEVVSPCYQRWCNNLNEPLDPFHFLGGC